MVESPTFLARNLHTLCARLTWTQSLFTTPLHVDVMCEIPLYGTLSEWLPDGLDDVGRRELKPRGKGVEHKIMDYVSDPTLDKFIRIVQFILTWFFDKYKAFL